MIILFLRGKISGKTRTREKSHKASITFINNSGKKLSSNISFSRCFGHGVLLVTIDLNNFELRQQRLYPLNW